MPDYSVYSRRRREDGSWPNWDSLPDFDVNAPTQTKAGAKAWEQIKRSWGDALDPTEYELKLELRSQQRTQTQFPPLESLEPVHNRLWREKVKRTNNPGTCLYCGVKLTRKYEKALGAYADNAFCSQRCGYIFGISCAVNGSRLVEYDTDEE